jgi:hypothetical protein
MLAPFLQKKSISQSSSSNLASKLRSGPIRAIIDRIVRSAAEATGLPYMVLGIRYGDVYEFISTQGVPLTHYRDVVPFRTFAPELFAREVEVSDLRKQTHFAVLSVVPVAEEWRYGGNVPVRLQAPLSDDGVLALSCADYKVRPRNGKIPSILRGYADTISDLIWMSGQVEQAVTTIDPVGVIKAVLLAGLSRLNVPVCVVDSNFSIIGYSKPFSEQNDVLGGTELQVGQPLKSAWFTSDLQEAARESLSNDLPRQWLRIDCPIAPQPLLDVYPVSFLELGTFGVLALHHGEHAIAAMKEFALPNEVRAPEPPQSTWGNDGPGPVSRFLLETLLVSQRLNRRGKTNYIGLRKWRTAIKQYQIEALKAVKASIPDGFVAAVADELAESVRSVYGDVNKCVVVPVPCGSSGTDCLSCRLAAGLARRLNVPMVQAFEQLDVPVGSSHPRRNIKRARMKLLRNIDNPVILVDDVATSGSHIDEAAGLLRQNSPQVWPVVWIAA